METKQTYRNKLEQGLLLDKAHAEANEILMQLLYYVYLFAVYMSFSIEKFANKSRHDRCMCDQGFVTQ